MLTAMTLLSIILALLLEQLKPLPASRIEAMAAAWAAWLERRLDAGEARHGVYAWLIGVALPVLLLLAIQALLAFWSPLLFLLLAVGTLWLTMGFRQFSHYFSAIETALNGDDLPRARQVLAQWTGGDTASLTTTELTRRTIEQALLASHRRLFAPLFCFVVFGPAGALLYRLSDGCAQHWRGHGTDGQARPFGAFADRVCTLIDWLPVRLSAATFAVAGDFEDALYCWRTQAARWPWPRDGVLLAAGAGALGVRLAVTPAVDSWSDDEEAESAALGLGDDAEPALLGSTVGLLWRTLLTILLLLTLLAVASWAG